ncbi:hypothetical protein GCM10009801_21360 [Streptomyces albiaxialis]|uniref:Uncharacterized protein n=2 Tax=Streptomyces albiaxialis TaxID=329523 RepID=A0ABN2VRY2_9ACTN
MDRPDTDKALHALGLMVREAAGTDRALAMIAEELCGGQYGRLLIAGESTSRVIKVCNELVDAHDDISKTLKSALKVLTKESESLFRVRHRYVHGSWAVDGTTSEPQLMLTKRFQAHPNFEKFSIAELHELAAKFNLMHDRLMDWLLQICSPGYQAGDLLKAREEQLRNLRGGN